MSSSSVSFRISRHTQDLAQTVHALSQRLVSIEQRLEALDLQLQALRQQPRQEEEAEAASLAPIEASIERLLQDCRQLLGDQPSSEAGFACFSQAADGETGTSLAAGVQDGGDAPVDGPLADDERDEDADEVLEAHAA